MTRAPILLATDHNEDQELILRALASFSLRDAAVIASDMDGAAAFLSDDEQPAPALVIVDARLPKGGGVALLSLLRTVPRLKRTPAIMLCGPADADCVQQAYDAGANSVIRKPASRSHFSEAVNHVIRYWMFLNQSG
jgi:CheY-like chemotaxis protein